MNTSRNPGSDNFKRLWPLALGAALLVIVAILLPRQPTSQSATQSGQSGGRMTLEARTQKARNSSGVARSPLSPTASAQEIVATKVSQFAANRREIYRAWAA